jgi:2-methylaconitate cis-trans-isomerase PrpF
MSQLTNRDQVLSPAPRSGHLLRDDSTSRGRHPAGELRAIRYAILRGGTSKGIYFREQDLPPAGAQRDTLLARLMGSPDVLQIDGLGGSRPITSKVAIVGRSHRTDADVDYTFAQVGIEDGIVHYNGNCGNISSGVGPFAIDEGMVKADDGVADVRIWNTNTQALLIASVQVRGGNAAVLGDFAIPGVPGTGAEIVMNWVHTVGAKTGRLLPTGEAVDQFEMTSGDVIEGTLCDVGNPVLWVPAEQLGLTGSEGTEEFNSDAALIERFRELRGRAAVAIGFCEDWRAADQDSPGAPLVGIVAPPEDYIALNGARAFGSGMDLRVRLMFMNRLHESIAGTASMSLAAASRVPGSVVARVSVGRRADQLLIGHPSGVTAVRVRASSTSDGVRFDQLGLSRTARRLMDCTAFYPLPGA